MKFAAIIEYGPDLSKIAEVRPTHRAYLGELLKNGKLAISGPFTDDTGALIVYEAESAEEAQKMISDDPFSKAGVFAKWSIRPWNAVFGNPELLPK
jgi:Uma2 family endonuclease/uncharacterized protein YciI